MDSLLDADAASSSGYQFASARRRPTAASLDYSEFGGSVTAPSSAGRDRSVELADDEVRMLAELAATLLEKLTAAYEAHEHQQRVDKKRWKSVKKREQLTVYKERSSDALAVKTTDADEDADAASDKVRTMPQLMLTGSVPGRMQDALYGLSSATTLAMKFRSAYTQDASVVDAEVLATIEGPSVDDPFRFLGLKWVLQNHASATKSFVKKRDIVFLESTGTTALASGELVGYHIVHSVNLHSRARMTSNASTGGSRSASSMVVRAKTSIGHLFRQRPSGGSGATDTVDVFMRGYYDPQGGMLQFVALNIAAEQLLNTATNSLECARLKKLSYAAHQSTRQRRRATTAAASRATQARSTTAGASSLMEDMAAAAQEVDREAAAARESRASVCAVCSRKFGKMLQRGGVSCTVCALMVCSRCSVTKKLSFTREDNANADIQHLVTDLERSGISVDSSSRSSVRPGRSSSSVKSVLSSALSVSASSSKVQSEICQKPMNFCTSCILKTSAQSAAHVAVEELLEQQALAHVRCAAAGHSNGGSTAPTPREVLAMHQRARRSTRAGSTQHYAGSSTTPRFTYNGATVAMITPVAAAAATAAAAAAAATTGTARPKTPRPKAFSTSSTASSTTSSVVLYEEPAAPTA